MAVGSQTIGIDDHNVRDSFTVVREKNPDGIVLANVSAGVNPDIALEAIEMIGADGLQLHFNVPQELAMPEGDRNFKGTLKNIETIVSKSNVPIIAKEVGFGFSANSVNKLYNSGINIFDIGGKGGTNFINIEDQRKGMFMGELDDWGIPTACSLAEIVDLNYPIQIIASGGIRTAYDAAKALAIGADLVGIASPFLKILLQQGVDELSSFVDSNIYKLKAVTLMTGAKNIKEIKTKPVIITKDTAEWLSLRGVDPYQWSKK
ncbi:Isopentenyl-diphosphate delta-isomerase, FMN-dependent [Candidatus Syntrophocurvum alkaliphilum]|uniref:Isopentenyl-diphosphate delta-isomerase, FMN-dependent n=2 Tax=Candidatus Syntrophocurvum alkaliphilum TaxID=2293317 RepID=A0A6I6DG00_9FIRM|nr:Isopentenyl-diphosphate delta-isomerase, FMN-dependent [Candidatus Syntrophocurvum alkaliphilum]